MPERRHPPAQNRNLAASVFALAVVLTAVLVWMGLKGYHWPRWLLVLTAAL